MAEIKIFTQAAIAERIKNNLLKREYTRAAVDDGVLDSFVQAVAEEMADDVRFKEYLTKENNWDAARNITSQLGAAKMIGYEPKRKRSATATLTFAVDPNISIMGGYSSLVYNENTTTGVVTTAPGIVSYANLRSLRNYPGMSNTTELNIPIGTIVKDEDSDLTYITMEEGLITYAGDLVTDQDSTVADTSRWTRVSAIQGILREFIAYGANGRAFERVSINSSNVEDMTIDGASESYLKVSVKVPGSTEFEEWTRVKDLREGGPYDKIYQVVNELDYSKVYIQFGNGYSGRQLLTGSDIKVAYLETEGADGNIDQSHRLTEITNLSPVYIPSGVSVYCTNMTPIISGVDVEDLDAIKDNAPLNYLTVDTIGSEEAYQSTIEGIGGIQRAKVFRGTYVNNQSGVERDTVSFTVIRQDGVEPNEYDILREVRLALGRKISPTDIIQYTAPEYVNIAYNIHGYIDDVTQPLQYFVNLIKDSLFDVYRIQNLNFKQSIYHLDVMGILKNEVNGLQSASAFPEAYITKDFYEGDFVLNDEGAYTVDFAFNTALAPFKEIKNDVEYILRVDFKVGPVSLANRSRSILVIPNPDYEDEETTPDVDAFIIRQFDLLENIVLTPARTRAILSDTLNTYGEKTLATWHWINRYLMVVDTDYGYDGGVVEVTEVTVDWTSAITEINDSYVQLNIPGFPSGESHYFYGNVDGAGVDPEIVGAIGHAVAIDSGEQTTEALVAEQFALAINAITGLNATNVDEVITVTNTNEGAVDIAVAAEALSIVRIQQGVDNYEGEIGDLDTLLTVTPATSYRVIEVEEGVFYLYYTEVSDISEGGMTEEEVLDYYDSYGAWKTISEWASDPIVLAAMEENTYFGSMPGVYAPDSTHMAPIEVTFLPVATGTQAGTGSIFIRPQYEGREVSFLPPDQYKEYGENGIATPCTLKILAMPQSLDLQLSDDFSIFNITKDNIKVDLRYRTEFDSEFALAYDDRDDEDEV